jgi:hypothetical protein
MVYRNLYFRIWNLGPLAIGPGPRGSRLHFAIGSPDAPSVISLIPSSIAFLVKEARATHEKANSPVRQGLKASLQGCQMSFTDAPLAIVRATWMRPTDPDLGRFGRTPRLRLSSRRTTSECLMRSDEDNGNVDAGDSFPLKVHPLIPGNGHRG